jgi:hypothetical protein
MHHDCYRGQLPHTWTVLEVDFPSFTRREMYLHRAQAALSNF